MPLIVLIIALVVIGTLRTLSFAVWNFRERNPLGGVAMIVLALAALASTYVLL